MAGFAAIIDAAHRGGLCCGMRSHPRWRCLSS
jgi:hypothetical protein